MDVASKRLLNVLNIALEVKTMTVKLIFGRDNAKLKALKPYVNSFLQHIGVSPAKLPKFPKIYTFSKLSGHTCPFAKDCLSKAVVYKGKAKIVDGEFTGFRCFSASQEVIYPNVYAARDKNTKAIARVLRGSGYSRFTLARTIANSLPVDANIIRIHVGGDFSSQPEFDAWIQVALKFPDKLFYAYTKSLPFWVARLGEIPDNFVLTASYGGYRDGLIDKYGLRFVRVVNSIAEAGSLPIDHDDSFAVNPAKRDTSFALLIHGIQPANSIAGKAVRKLNGLGSYGKASRKGSV